MRKTSDRLVRIVSFIVCVYVTLSLSFVYIVLWNYRTFCQLLTLQHSAV